MNPLTPDGPQSTFLPEKEAKNGLVLIVDDSLTIRTIIGNVLSRKYNVLLAADGQTAFKLAKEHTPDLILLDVVMPDLDGFAVCAQLRSTPVTADIPVIFLTSLEGESEEIMALEAGGIDFLHKPANPIILMARVKNHMELKQSRDKLKAISLIDGLTGIGNRRRFDSHLEEEWRRAKRNGGTLSLILGDVDFFKRYNDSYGHMKGDECLKAVAQSFAACINRAGDLAARYGGEEFACVLPDTLPQGAVDVAEKIHAHLSQKQIPHQASDASPFVTLSLGVASVTFDDNATLGSPEDLLTAADQKLYAAKQSGRNRTCSPLLV